MFLLRNSAKIGRNIATRLSLLCYNLSFLASVYIFVNITLAMDISIYDNYSGTMPDFEFRFFENGMKSCSSLLAAICLDGNMVVHIGRQEYAVGKNSFVIAAPDTPLGIKWADDKLRIDVLRIGVSLFELANDAPLKMQLNRMLYENPVYGLSEEKATMFHHIHSYLKIITKESENKYRDTIVYGYIRILFWEACSIITDNSFSSCSSDRPDITKKFFRCLEEQFKEKKTVENYASQLGITPKYLSHTLRKTTGKQASEWIDEYSLLEAKKLLSHSYNTIQEISYDLNFSTPSHFSKFFKSKTGMTPKEFRQQSETKNGKKEIRY